MEKYVVIKPLSQVTPEKGFQTYTHGDLIELEEKEAARMIEAGIVQAGPSGSPKVLRAEPIEKAVMPEADVEKAVKRGKKEK